MHQRFFNMRDAFRKSAEEHVQPVIRLLRHSRAAMDASWEELKEGWTANNERMVKLGLSPRTRDEDAVQLNVGGSIVTLSWHLLAEIEGFKGSILFALLEGVWGKGRVLRDADGRIVLDESPACIKHIIHTMLIRFSNNDRASSVAKEVPGNEPRSSAVDVDEVPCLIYTARVMRLTAAIPTHLKYAMIDGGSVILGPRGIALLGAKIREWVGGSTEQMTLFYRATRDGFDTKSFPTSDNFRSLHVVSVIRVNSDEGNGNDSVVGGYSAVPFKFDGDRQTIAEKSFLFMLKDGSATRENPSKPIKWKPYPDTVGNVCRVTETCGACVGHDDLITVLDATAGGCTLRTANITFDIEGGSPFLKLQGKKVVEVEVYTYLKPAAPTDTAIAPSNAEPVSDVLADAKARDVRSFGESIASSLMEERVVLNRAVKEMEAAGARVSAAVGALETVYGPRVAAGESDDVVELNVRGVRMTTLRSTLQACPRSALAAMFNDDRWPPTDKDKDECGGRLIDCSPTCFSKILDVLRIRKRASWSRSMGEGGQEDEREKGRGQEEESGVVPSGAVLVKEADAEALGIAVNMYFPGCESFIMDLVEPV